VRSVTPAQLAAAARARGWFTPERPGPLVGAHVVRTGIGTALVDRWPDPSAVLVDAGGNLSLAGEPDALDAGTLRRVVRGFLEVPAPFAALADRAFPDAARWQRRILVLPARPARVGPVRSSRVRIRRLVAADAGPLAALGGELSWISASWGGPAGLAASGTAWGAHDGGRLVSVACPFFAGSRFEDLGVVTEPGWRGQGLSTACAGALCADVLARGRVPSWTTSPDNAASLRVAERLGFRFVRADELLAVGVAIPP
jgi:RimJ/RimL family protein N-acetyltransferase